MSREAQSLSNEKGELASKQKMLSSFSCPMLLIDVVFKSRLAKLRTYTGAFLSKPSKRFSSKSTTDDRQEIDLVHVIKAKISSFILIELFNLQ